MILLTSLLTLSILVIGRCRDLNHATGGTATVPAEEARIKVCIDQHLGCFPETEPGVEPSWGEQFYDWRANKIWRDSRDTVGTEFRFWQPGKKSALVFTNGNFHVYFEEKDAGFDTSIMTYFIIHGFRGGDAEWALKMKNELMKKQLCNVIIVDWSGGDGFTYATAAQNTWVVGAESGRLIERLGIKAGLTLDKVHIIGHSLGAHASGKAGKWLKYKLNKLVGRITGLDPAGPDFEGVVEGERLDMGDAEFVDIIHTNWAESWEEGLGIIKPIGHFDFYPNGGEDQPGCPTAGQTAGEFAMEALEIISPVYKAYTLIEGDEDDIGDAMEDLSCSHGRAIQFFTESINSPCRFTADQCTSWEDYQAGKCPPGGLTSVPMGFHAKEYKNAMDPKAHKKFYLRTKASEPYCIA